MIQICCNTDIETFVVGVLRHTPAELSLGVEQAVHVIGAPHLGEKTEAHHRQYDRSLSILFITEKTQIISFKAFRYLVCAKIPIKLFL